MKKGKMIELQEENEAGSGRAFLVGIQRPGEPADETLVMMDELIQLCQNIQLEVVETEIVKLRQPNPKLLIGKGKAEEISAFCLDHNIDVIVFDNDLSPYQQRNWETLTGIDVIDRSQVILDIFAERAETREAILQVRLASLRYGLPRLVRAWTHLGRQAGGAGSGHRGEGEQQIELDRRTIKDEINKVEKLIEEVGKHRETQRKHRLRQNVSTAAIVGYTNSGKSSLLNRLTDARALQADKLFATLDPLTKPVVLRDNNTLLLTDTVGFVSRLPHLLVESFRATLEEAVVADFLIQIIDAASPYLEKQVEVTSEVLAEIGADEKDVLMVFNKVDLLKDREFGYLDILKKKYQDAQFISAKTGEGIDGLLDVLSEYARRTLRLVTLRIPQSDAGAVSVLHQKCVVLSKEYEGNDILIEARVSPAVLNSLAEYVQV